MEVTQLENDIERRRSATQLITTDVAFFDRRAILGVTTECAKKLQKRTLTNLYNERPTWLGLAHQKLAAAIAAAYGWSAELAEEEILARLLKLNLERAERGAVAVPAVDC